MLILHLKIAEVSLFNFIPMYFYCVYHKAQSLSF